MMHRTVSHPGVLVAAIISPLGAPAALLRSWIDGGYELVVSPNLLAEIRMVLLRPNVRKYLSEEEAVAYVTLLEHLAIHVEDPPETPRLTKNPRDDYLVSLAQSARAHYLVSTNSHLIGLSNQQPSVLTPREFARRISISPSP